MTRTAILTLSLICGLGLAACDSANLPYSDYNGHYAYPSTVVRKTAYLDIAALQAGTPSTNDRGRIGEFVHAYRQEGESPIAVTITAASVSDAAGRKDATDVAVWLQRQGVPAKDIRLFIKESPVKAGPQLTFPIYVVGPRKCGDWTEPVEQNWHSEDSQNFGCAVQKNVDAMIANPRDLLMPRDTTGRDANRSWQIVDNYQQGKAIPGANDLKAEVNYQIGVVGQ